MRGPGRYPTGGSIVGLVGVLYALSDLGWIGLPRPSVMTAVPVTWWLRRRVYHAAALYGTVLRLGITSRIPFGAFYILLAWCAVKGEVAYGALLMGTYGGARAVVIFPASYAAFRRFQIDEGWMSVPFLSFDFRRLVVAGLLLFFSAATVVDALAHTRAL